MKLLPTKNGFIPVRSKSDFIKTGGCTILDNYFSETEGFLIFQFQFESIYQDLTGVSNEIAIKIRKDINKQKISAYNELKNIPFGLKFNLYDIVKERMLFGYLLTCDN